MSRETERAALHRAIWQVANDLRGSVDGWDFKAYVLGFLFYRFISENLTEYINAGEREAGDPDFDYRFLGLLGVFRTVLVLCFRLPSSGPGTRFRPRRECDTLGLSEDEYDCISARSTRQYRSSPCPSLGIPSGTLSHS